MKLQEIHNRILKEKIRQAVREIREHAPEIEAEKRIQEFISNVNVMKFRERISIAWRIIIRKM